MRALLSLSFVVLATSAIADIGASLDSLKKKHGAVAKVGSDLHSTSYALQRGDLLVEFVLTPDTVSRLNVFFRTTPQDKPEALLEQFSGRSGWKRRPLTDPEFKKQFPDYSVTDTGNQFYVVGEVYALAKPDSGGAKLILLIQTSDFLRYVAEIAEYRKGKKRA